MTFGKIDSYFSKYSDISLFFLRLAIGIPFLLHGVGKLLNWGPFASGVSGVVGFFGSLGIPAPALFAWIVSLVETFGGLFLILGFLTRTSALLLSINSLVALLLVHLSKGYSLQQGGFEYILVLFLGSLSILFGGPGKKLTLGKGNLK